MIERIVGHTQSGKCVYLSKDNGIYSKFTAMDHLDSSIIFDKIRNISWQNDLNEYFSNDKERESERKNRLFYKKLAEYHSNMAFKKSR